MKAQEPNLDLIKVLIEAKNQQNISKSKVDQRPWRGIYTNTIETIWIYLN